MNPRNVEEIPDADGVGTVGNAKCGDITQMFIKVSDKGIIEDVKFRPGRGVISYLVDGDRAG